jgi:hypothetical protein
MGSPETDRDAQIRARAHEIWEAEGRPEGRDADHWHQAERELGMTDKGASGGPVSHDTGDAAAEGQRLDDELNDTFPGSDAPTATRRE